jgi:hypothetical protein
MPARRTAVIALAGLLAVLLQARGQNLGAPPPPPDCGSVVVIKCDRPEPSAADRAKQEAARRMQERRANRAAVELDRVIIEGDAERPVSPEQSISRALSRAPVLQGEQTFVTGEGAQCTCRSPCPPPPLPCCSCTDRVGSRHATAPGWKPTN